MAPGRRQAAAPDRGANHTRDWIVNLIVWLAIFVTGAAWRLRHSTARV
jgi:hypothetical protein